MYEELFATIITKEALHHFLTSLDELQEKLYSVKTTVLNEIETTLPFDKKELFLTLCQRNHVAIQNPQSLKQCISIMRKEAESIPLVKLSIAYTPSEEELKTLSTWFQSQVQQKYIFDVSIDHSLVGGAVISANGFYKDFSLKRYLNEHVNVLEQQYQKTS